MRGGRSASASAHRARQVTSKRLPPVERAVLGMPSIYGEVGEAAIYEGAKLPIGWPMCWPIGPPICWPIGPLMWPAMWAPMWAPMWGPMWAAMWAPMWPPIGPAIGPAMWPPTMGLPRLAAIIAVSNRNPPKVIASGATPCLQLALGPGAWTPMFVGALRLLKTEPRQRSVQGRHPRAKQIDHPTHSQARKIQETQNKRKWEGRGQVTADARTPETHRALSANFTVKGGWPGAMAVLLKCTTAASASECCARTHTHTPLHTREPRIAVRRKPLPPLRGQEAYLVETNKADSARNAGRVP